MADVREDFLVLALLAAHDLRHDEQLRALRQLADLVDHLVDRLLRDGLAALRTVRMADAREEQSEVVVNLRDRADGRARVVARRLLVDRDGRREAVNLVDIRLVHLAEELARVRRERLDIAALALGVDRIEGQGRLARAREARDDDELVARDVNVDVLEVVGSGAPYLDVSFHCFYLLSSIYSLSSIDVSMIAPVALTSCFACSWRPSLVPRRAGCRRALKSYRAALRRARTRARATPAASRASAS